MKIIHSNDRTAGLTSEAAVAAIGNRYDLVLVASRRLRELNRGDMRKVASKNSNSVAVLEEIGHTLGFMSGTRTRGIKPNKMDQVLQELQEAAYRLHKKVLSK